MLNFYSFPQYDKHLNLKDSYRNFQLHLFSHYIGNIIFFFISSNFGSLTKTTSLFTFFLPLSSPFLDFGARFLDNLDAVVVFPSTSSTSSSSCVLCFDKYASSDHHKQTLEHIVYKENLLYF